MLYDDELYMLKSNKIYVMLCYANTVTRGDTAYNIIGRPNTKVCGGEIVDQLEHTKLIGHLPVRL